MKHIHYPLKLTIHVILSGGSIPFCFISEEAIVMANLRKRVATCDLEKRRPLSDASGTSELNQDELDNRPLLSKVR